MIRLPLDLPKVAPGPDLRQYDQIVVAISGGKDSMAGRARDRSRARAPSQRSLKSTRIELGIGETLTTSTTIGDLLEGPQDPLGYARAYGHESIASWEG